MKHILVFSKYNLLFVIASISLFSNNLYSQNYSFSDSSGVNKESSVFYTVPIKQMDKALKQGYLFASVDSFLNKEDSLKYWKLNKFNKYNKLILEIKFESSDIETHIIEGNSFSKLHHKLEELLNVEIKNGFLRSYYQYDSLFLKENNVIVKYRVIRNNKYKVDSIHLVKSNSSLNTQFLRNYINLYFKNKSNFDWKEIVQHIKYFDFIEIERNPDFTLLDSTAILNLYLKERKLNQVNAILGILSNGYNTGKVDLTGDVRLSLYNLFKHGVSFQLNWQKNLDNSQFLYSKVNFPFILKTKLGVGGYFNIEKFDTSFLRVQYQLSFNYHIQSNKTLSLFLRKNNSTIVGFNSVDLLNNKLPEYLDFTTNEVGLGFNFYKLDRPLFSKKGWQLETNFLAGNKTTIINPKISELRDLNGVSLARLYDSIPLSQYTLSFLLDLTKYTRLGRDFILKSRFDSKVWISETVSKGEMYYLGGNKMPRGFDDNSFTSPWYVSVSAELQYYLSEYFYSNIFVDIASIKNKLKDEILLPIGAGAGISFKTSDNIFSLNIGSGYLGESKFSLEGLKVHINYVSVF